MRAASPRARAAPDAHAARVFAVVALAVTALCALARACGGGISRGSAHGPGDASALAGALDGAVTLVDARACARHATVGRWRVGDEACAPGAWTLASAGCERGAAARALGAGGWRRRTDGEFVADWIVRSDVGERCGFGALTVARQSERVRELIGGRRAAFAGDSGARSAYGAFVKATSEAWRDVSLKTNEGEKHRDWAHDLVSGAKATFTWAPYAGDVLAALDSVGSTADLIVISSSLWHVLHDDSTSTYKSQMEKLGERVRAIAASRPNVVIVWLDAPGVFPDKLVAEDKRRQFTEQRLAQFAKIVQDQKTTKIVDPAGPAIRVRVTDIALACGAECSTDGVHSRDVVYDVIAQIVLNIARTSWR